MANTTTDIFGYHIGGQSGVGYQGNVPSGTPLVYNGDVLAAVNDATKGGNGPAPIFNFSLPGAPAAAASGSGPVLSKGPMLVGAAIIILGIIIAVFLAKKFF